MVTTKLNLSMTEPQVRQIYAKQGDTGRVLDIALDQTPEDGTLRILRPDGVEVTSEAVTGGEVESGSSFESLTEADVTELAVGIEPVQDLSHGDPSPSNICPITGHDEVTVTRTGKNFLNPAKYEWQTRTFNGITYTVLSDGSVRAVGTSTAVGGPGLTSRFQLPAGTYYGNSSTGSGLSVLYRYAMQKTGGTTYPTNNPFVSDGTQWFYINLYCNAANLTVDTVLYPQIELGTTFTGYEPYQGSTYTTSLGQTVYGGTLDMVSGKLVVDRVSMTFNGTQTIGLANWRPLTNSVGWLYRVAETPNILREEIKTSNISTTKLKSDTLRVAVYAGNSGIYGGDFPCISIVGGNNWGIVMRVNDTSLTTNNAINAYLENHPIQVVYPLATPTEVDLTPTQISTLLGENNVWASSGDIVNIKFTYGGLLSELPSDATSIVGKCYCDVEQNGVSSMPFTLNVKKNERES